MPDWWMKAVSDENVVSIIKMVSLMKCKQENPRIEDIKANLRVLRYREQCKKVKKGMKNIHSCSRGEMV
jgi:hypothetical protein